MKTYISDGYTESGYIAERRGVYEACRFKYRRMLHAARARIAATNGNSDAFAKALYLGLESHVKEWDVVKWTPGDGKNGGEEKSEPLPIKAVNIANLAPEFIEVLFNIVAGFRASDDDPQAAPKIEPDELDAVISGGNIHDRTAETDAKN